MTGLRAYVRQLERAGRSPCSIAFVLAQRGIVPDIDEAYRVACTRGERPDIESLLNIGAVKAESAGEIKT
jgi:hypothetical protein